MISELASRVARLRLNRLQRSGDWWLKERLPGASLAIAACNVVLRWSHFPIHLFVQPLRWRMHEIESYQLLHGPDLCRIAGARALAIRHLPGQTLKSLRLDARLARLAARELRRCHDLEGWSHGDPHLGNLLYDGERCRLFDFDTRHDSKLGPAERHADDLLVLLLQLSACSIELAASFLTEYACPRAQAALARDFSTPGGWKLTCWQVRCAFETREKLRESFLSVERLVRG